MGQLADFDERMPLWVVTDLEGVEEPSHSLGKAELVVILVQDLQAHATRRHMIGHTTFDSS